MMVVYDGGQNCSFNCPHPLSPTPMQSCHCTHSDYRLRLQLICALISQASLPHKKQHGTQICAPCGVYR